MNKKVKSIGEMSLESIFEAARQGSIAGTIEGARKLDLRKKSKTKISKKHKYCAEIDSADLCELYKHISDEYIKELGTNPLEQTHMAKILHWFSNQGITQGMVFKFRLKSS